jgi:hypothetical protein
MIEIVIAFGCDAPRMRAMTVRTIASVMAQIITMMIFAHKQSYLCRILQKPAGEFMEDAVD